MLAAVDTTPTREEFRSFYEENFQLVWRTLRRLGVREADLSDLSHDVLVFAYNHFDEIPAYPHGWLARVCFEMVRNYRRKAARRLERLAPQVIEAAVDQQTSDETMTEVVLEALDRMPEAQRMLLLRYYVREEPLHTLAKSIGCARSTVQLRLAAAETAFEGWVKTLLGVDAGTGSRASLFMPFSLVALLPKVWESSEVLAKAHLEGWERLARAIDAAKLAAGAPRPKAPPTIETGVGAMGLPAKLTLVFAVAVPAVVVGMLLGHLGSDVASAQTAVAPSLHAATTPVAVIVEALVKNGSPSRTVQPTPLPPVSQAKTETPAPPEDKEVSALRTIRGLLKEQKPKEALDAIREHEMKWPDSSHATERNELIATAKAKKAAIEAEKAAKVAENKLKPDDKPKP